MDLSAEATLHRRWQISSMIQPQDHMVLVRVRAFRRNGPLVEFSGVVEGLGEQVAGFRAGDDVHGTAAEVFADYVCVHCGSIRHAAHE
jgi:threonine dehydrogenase-like Zn-dependent dehydrogenase